MLSLFLAIALIFTMIGPSYAAVTDIVVQGAAGDTNLYQYDYAELNASYMNYLMGDTAGASLYLDFMNKTYPPVAFKDSEKGYVDYNDVSNAYMNALMSGSDWNTDNYTSTLAAPADMPPTVKATSVIGGEITTVDTPTSTTAITITAVTAIDPKTVDVGTGFKSLGLPTTNKVTYSDGTTADLAISEWGGDKYEKDIAGVYNLLAVLTLPTGVTYGEGVTGPTCKVTVVDSQAAIVAAAEGAVAAYEAAAITTAEEITAAEALEVTANEKAALVADADKKAAFEARIAAKKAAVDAAKAALVKLVVSSVSAINCSELKVTFNKDLNLTAAQVAANYVIRDNNGAAVQVDNAKLGENLRDVTLTIGDGAKPIAFDTTKKYTVTVAKDLSQATAPALATALVSSEVSVVDTALPTVTAVTPVGNLAVDVTFSKPVLLNTTAINTFAEKKADGTYADGQDYQTAATNFTSATYVANSGYKQVKLSFAAKPAGSYDLRIYGGATNVRDASGLNMVTSTRTYTVAEATTVAQAIALTVNNRTQVDVTFDGAVQVPASPATLYWGTAGTANNVAAVSPTKLRYTFTTNVIPVGSQTFTVSPTANRIADGYGNNVPTKTFTVDVTADSAATATVIVVDDDTIDVVFSKQMKCTNPVNSTTAGEASNKTHFVLKNAAGTVVNLSDVTAIYSEVNNVYKTRLNKTNWNLTPGNYTISVSNIKDIYGDNMTAITDLAITVTDTTKPDITSNGSTGKLTVAGVSGTRQISIIFTEAMAISGENSIANANNYRYAADGSTWVDLPAGTTLTAAADGKSVMITLPVGTTLTPNTSKIQVGKVAASKIQTVADAAGNIQDPLPGVNTQYLVAGDATPAINNNATIVKDATTINVAVTNKLGTVVAADFKYTVNGTTWKPVSNAQLVVNPATGAHSIDFTISDTLSAMTDRTKVQVKVDNATPGTKSALGTAISNGTSAAPVATLTAWPFRTAIASAEILDATHLRVVFTGLVGAVGADAGPGNPDKLEEFLTVTGTKASDGTAASLTGFANIPATKDGNSAVILTLGTALDVTKEVKVKTYDFDLVAPAEWAKDANGVIYQANTTGVVATASTAFGVVSFEPTINASGLLADGDKFVITFNKAVDPASIKTGWDGSSQTDCDLDISADGTITSTAYNFGAITGFGVPGAIADFTDAATIALDGTQKILTITVKDKVGAAVNTKLITVNGTLNYVANSNIASLLGDKLGSVSKTATAAVDAKPIIYTIQAVNKTGGTADSIENGDKIIITFSEPVSATSINAGLTAGGTVTGVAANATGGVTGASANGTITVTDICTFVAGTALAGDASFTTDLTLSADGKTLTILLNTGTTQAVTNPADIASLTQVAGTVKDLTGNAMAAGGTPVAGASKRF